MSLTASQRHRERERGRERDRETERDRDRDREREREGENNNVSLLCFFLSWLNLSTGQKELSQRTVPDPLTAIPETSVFAHTVAAVHSTPHRTALRYHTAPSPRPSINAALHALPVTRPQTGSPLPPFAKSAKRRGRRKGGVLFEALISLSTNKSRLE